MAIVKFYNCDPKDAPKTTMPAHLGANAIITCNGKLLLEGSNSAVSSTWVLYDLSGGSYGVSEQIWTSDEPHDLADFAPYYYYSRPYEQADPIVYDAAARLIESWEQEIYLPTLTPIT